MTGAFEHLFVNTNNILLHVVAAGHPAGRPVILLHGFPDFWVGWSKQLPALVEAGFRVIIPDQRGYNLSEHPHGTRSYRVEELGGDIIGLLDNFGFEKVDLVGHDWGAAVAWWLAENFPGRIKHLGILNVPHPSVMVDFIRRSPRQMIKSWYILFFQIPGLADWLMHLNNYSLAAKMLLSSGRPGTFTDEDLLEYRKAWTNSGGLTGMINWYRALIFFRPSGLKNIRISVPTLVLWGKRDVALSQEMAQELIVLCDNGRLKFFDAASHWVQRDAAFEVNRELVDFLK